MLRALVKASTALWSQNTDRKEKTNKTVPPNPEYQQAGGGREAVKIERAAKVEVRWEGRGRPVSSERSEGRRKEKGDQSCSRMGETISPSLATKRETTVKHAVLPT